MKKLETMRPDLQISFALRLRELSQIYLDTALASVVKTMNISEVDRELSAYIDGESLALLASYGLRGEIWFPVPILLNAQPKLLGYYRYLYGFSQKAFYSQGPFGRFKSMEADGFQGRDSAEIVELCKCMCISGSILLRDVGRVDLRVIRDLQVLTVGAQLRGSENNKIGNAAQAETLAIMTQIVESAGVEIEAKLKRSIVFRNATGRKILMEAAADPDVRVVEAGDDDFVRPVLAIEVKGGSDVSNIHNRLGEAEKSHQKARAAGFQSRWTIVNANVDLEIAKQESPSTDEFFQLEELRNVSGAQFKRFRELIRSHLSIR